MSALEPEDRRTSAGRRGSDMDAHEFASIALDAMSALQSAVEGLGRTIGNLATKDEVKESEGRQDRRRRWAIGGVIALIVLLVLPVIGQYATLQEVQDLATENTANGDLLVECTTPGVPTAVDPADRVHECYDRGQAATANAVAQISLALLDAATCARTEEAPETIAECYATRIQSRTGLRPPTDATGSP